MQLSLLAGLAVVTLVSSQPPGPLPPFPPPQKGERIMVVAPHPDDEVLGAGGLIQQAVAAGAEVRVVYLTNGDHNQVAFKLFSGSLHLNAREYLAFGERRRNEAIAATQLLGLHPGNLTFLGYPDYGTLAIWRDYWASPGGFSSDATRTNAVPYPEDFAYRHLYKPENIVTDMAAVIREFKPARILVTHPADTNPDHRAAANFVRLALLQLAGEKITAPVYYYVVHFGDWPRPLHYHPDVELAPPADLLEDGQWMTLPLLPEQTEIKDQAILLNRTQLTTRQYYLEAFARTNEIFATIPPEIIPVLAADEELDMRKAVKAKTLTIFPTHHYQNRNDPLTKTEPTTIPLETVEFLRQQDDLLAMVTLKNRLGKRTGVHLYLYAYKKGVPFAAMPKVEVRLSLLGNLVINVGGERVLDHAVTLATFDNRILIRVPMRLLGGADADHMFASARAHWGEIAPDDAAWQLLEFQSDQTE